MRHLARCLALAACVALSGSAASAAPARRGGHHGKLHKKRKHRASADAPARVAHEEDVVVVTDDPIDAPPAALHEHAAPRAQDWHFAIGPDVWASSVDAKVSLGSQTVTTGVDFMQVSRHVRYGVPVLAEARAGRLSFVGDLMYGVVDVVGAKDVGPLMVTVNGTASSLQLDGFAGYRIVGDERSLLALEARGGVRYARTAISATLGVDGSTATSLESIDGGADALAGARVFVRPTSWLDFSGAADVGVFGSSASTWSATAAAQARVTSRLLVSLGWRTLSTRRAAMEIVMHGPLGALQLLF